MRSFRFIPLLATAFSPPCLPRFPFTHKRHCDSLIPACLVCLPSPPRPPSSSLHTHPAVYIAVLCRSMLPSSFALATLCLQVPYLCTAPSSSHAALAYSRFSPPAPATLRSASMPSLGLHQHVSMRGRASIPFLFHDSSPTWPSEGGVRPSSPSSAVTVSLNPTRLDLTSLLIRPSLHLHRPHLHPFVRRHAALNRVVPTRTSFSFSLPIYLVTFTIRYARLPASSPPSRPVPSAATRLSCWPRRR
ncbi:hypothetical protein R3P38DRAFT_3561919 [Favolaschia claudopus]|uniref:Uncharacterized protein n=1 Tax=Favolaschia claudopus TaxID=2862362 RepID=A0AAW0ATH0_9AGAR